MANREKVIKDLEEFIRDLKPFCGNHEDWKKVYAALDLLEEQENLKQKMWNALYAEEDNLEEKFIGTEKHNDWFTVYRPWLQRGFDIAIAVIAKQDGM